MKIINIIKDFEVLCKSLGYDLWFGTKNSYNSKREVRDKEIILEPFKFPVESKSCQYKTNWTIWIGIRQERGNESAQLIPSVYAQVIDEMRDEAKKLIEKINKSDGLLITETIYTIDLEYFEAASTATVNNQSFLKFTVPITLYKKI